MKKCLLLLIGLVLFSSLAAAQVLSGASPNPPGVWTVALFGARQTNVGNISALYQTTYGAAANYGLGNNLQVNLTYENGTFGGIPGFDQTLACYSLSLLYNLVAESERCPVSVAFLPSYSLLSQNTNPGGTLGGSNYGLGFVASKMIGAFVPYVDLLYSSTSLGGVSTDWELTAGSVWLFSERFFLIGENSWLFQPDGSTQGRAALALAGAL